MLPLLVFTMHKERRLYTEIGFIDAVKKSSRIYNNSTKIK